MDSFRNNVKGAHGTMQYLLGNLGKVISTGGDGSCRTFKGLRDVLIHYPVYSNPPADLEGLHAEYRAIINEAVKGVDPVFNVCSGGGGTIDTATFQQMLNVLDASQNRMYEVRKQLEGRP